MKINDVFEQYKEVAETLKPVNSLEEFEKLDNTNIERDHLNGIACITIRYKNILVYVDRDSFTASDSITVYDELDRIIYDDGIKDLEEKGWEYSYK